MRVSGEVRTSRMLANSRVSLRRTFKSCTLLINSNNVQYSWSDPCASAWPQEDSPPTQSLGKACPLFKHRLAEEPKRILVLVYLAWGSCWSIALFCSYSLRILPCLPKSVSVRFCQLLCIKPSEMQLCTSPGQKGRACRAPDVQAQRCERQCHSWTELVLLSTSCSWAARCVSYPVQRDTDNKRKPGTGIIQGARVGSSLHPERGCLEVFRTCESQQWEVRRGEGRTAL